MAISYKRTLIQIPLKDVQLFEEYANYYNLSFSGAIVQLAKKGLEQEQVIKYIPDIVNMYHDYKDSSQNNKKVSKKRKVKKS